MGGEARNAVDGVATIVHEVNRDPFANVFGDLCSNLDFGTKGLTDLNFRDESAQRQKVSSRRGGRSICSQYR